mgnify:FL=1
MNKIILHWTAGTNQPCSTDYEHYHYLINKDGVILKGKFSPEDNLNCNDDRYAQHCGGGNTGAIGVSMCGMYVPKGINIKDTKFPLTRIQCEAAFKLIAELCKKYNIKITPQTVLTHYEFGQAHPKTSSYGKIDIVYLHPFPEIDKKNMGDFIRSKIRWYFNKL